MNEIIENLDKYIDLNYRGAKLFDRGEIHIKNFLQRQMPGQNNCTIASLARVFQYFLKSDESIIYNDIYEIAKEKSLIMDFGVFPTKIDNIANEYSKINDLNIICKGVYLGTFYLAKREIINDRPLIMNIGNGPYKDHSVSVCGYSIYDFLGLRIKFLHIIDGWSKDIRYFDYSYFCGLFSLGIFSFNIFKIQKS